MRSSRYCHNYTSSHAFVNGHAESQANCVPAPRTREKSAELGWSMKILHVRTVVFAAPTPLRAVVLAAPTPLRAAAGPLPPEHHTPRLRSCCCLSLAGAVLGLFDERRDIRM
jgi:hypothetical protein